MVPAGSLAKAIASSFAAALGCEGARLGSSARGGRFVVCHDELIDRTSRGSGQIQGSSFVNLHHCDFLHGRTDFAGTHIPRSL